jgi:hypothetical protein
MTLSISVYQEQTDAPLARQARYGWESVRSVECASADGRLPPPEYPLGPKRPLWDQEKLEANERAAIKRPAGSGDAQ